MRVYLMAYSFTKCSQNLSWIPCFGQTDTIYHKGGMGHGGPIFKEPKDEQRIYILRLGKGDPVIELRVKIP